MSPSQTLPDLTGEFIDDGCLLLLCLLGSGSYGKVYKALDTSSPAGAPEYYAVKCLRRFAPGTRDASSPRTNFYTAMVDRGCFKGNVARVKRSMNEILDAVEFLHRNSVYHRDIKPENILCNAAGTDIHLADFGLATQVALSTQFGCGSRSYMSPESLDRAYAHGCYSTRHSDLWAITVLFTNMIAGRYPWSTAETSDVGFAAFRDNDNFLLKALKLTRPTNALLERCFDANPLRRPSLAQFREAINEMDSFVLSALPKRPTRVAVPRLPSLPVDASLTLAWAVAPTSAPSADCEQTPRPAFTPQFHFNPFALGASDSNSDSPPPWAAPTPNPPSSLSLPLTDSSLPSTGSSVPSSAPDSSLPATPLSASAASRLPAPAAVGLGLGLGIPAVPPRASNPRKFV
ncbi:kinase-like domain-containing protein [Mycena filopes]|nr:kinase-like domain-containing protein [Mycena filopes]